MLSTKAEDRVQARMDLMMLAYRATDRSERTKHWQAEFEQFLVDDEELVLYRKAREILRLDTDAPLKPHSWRVDGVCRNCFVPKNSPLADCDCQRSRDDHKKGLQAIVIQRIKAAMRGRFQIHGMEIHDTVVEKLVAKETLGYKDTYLTERYIRRLLITSVMQEYRHAPTEEQLASVGCSNKCYMAQIKRGTRNGYRTHFWYLINWSKL